MSDPMNPGVWFEIPVSDLDRAKSFYEAVFGYEMNINEMEDIKMAWFPMHRDAPAAAGALVHGKTYVPSHNGTMIYLHVDNIEGTLKRVEQHGGKTVTPKIDIGENGFFGHFEDTEGNRIGVHSMQ